MESIRQVQAASVGTYGHRRAHAEFVPGRGMQVSHGRVERLMRHTGLQGAHRRRLRGCTRRFQAVTPSADLVGRRFNPTEPDRLYVADVPSTAPARASSTWPLSSTASAAGSWAGRLMNMADQIRSELVVDALQMAIWNRQPPVGAIDHSDHGSKCTSWVFGHRLRDAGLLGSMGTIVDGFDNSVAESFSATLQTELLDPFALANREVARERGLHVDRELLKPDPSPLDARQSQLSRLRNPARPQDACWAPKRDRSMISTIQTQ